MSTTTTNSIDREAHGINRTGIGMSPVDGADMVRDAKEAPIAPDRHLLEELRQRYIRAAEPIGTMPPPSTVKGAVKTAVDLMKGTRPTVLLDKLGERLAFERSGARLYEALLLKLDALGTFAGGPQRADLLAIHDDELAHFALLRDAMETLGADPTAVTPSADLAGVETLGVVQVLADPRTTLPQGLHAVLLAELADRDGWELLVRLARDLKQDRLADRFVLALSAEERHLLLVRRWLTAQVEAEAQGQESDARPAAEVDPVQQASEESFPASDAPAHHLARS